MPLGVIAKNSTYIYTVGNILVSLDYQKGDFGTDDVSILKNALDIAHRYDQTYSSRIEIINQKKFLITSRNAQGIQGLSFIGLSKSGHIKLIGTLQYDPVEETNAQNFLKDLLSSVTYKK